MHILSFSITHLLLKENTYSHLLLKENTYSIEDKILYYNVFTIHTTFCVAQMASCIEDSLIPYLPLSKVISHSSYLHFDKYALLSPDATASYLAFHPWALQFLIWRRGTHRIQQQKDRLKIHLVATHFGLESFCSIWLLIRLDLPTTTYPFLAARSIFFLTPWQGGDIGDFFISPSHGGAVPALRRNLTARTCKMGAVKVDSLQTSRERAKGSTGRRLRLVTDMELTQYGFIGCYVVS
jgi:hypothetical protein